MMPSSGNPRTPAPTSPDDSTDGPVTGGPVDPAAAAAAKRAKLIVFAVVVIDLLGFGIVMPLLPLYAQKLQASDLTIGLFMASFSAMQFLFAPVWGRISDRIGRRPVLLLGLGGSAAFYGLFAVATAELNLALLFAARIGAGIAGANIGVAQAVIADTTPPEKRAGGMAMIGAAFGIGFTFGPLLGSFWVSDDPMVKAELSSAVGWLAAALSATAFLAGWKYLPETRKPGTEPPHRRTWIDPEGVRTALADRGVGLAVAAFFLAVFAFGHFEGVLARVTADTFGWSLRENFYGFAAVGLTLALAQGLLVRRLAPKLGEVALARLGTFLMTAGLAGLGAGVWSQSIGIIAAVLPVLVTGFAMLNPAVQSIISLRTPADRQGAVLGLNQSAGSLARILGPLLGNVFYGATAGGLLAVHTVPFAVGAAAMAAAFGLTMLFRRPWDAGESRHADGACGHGHTGCGRQAATVAADSAEGPIPEARPARG